MSFKVRVLSLILTLFTVNILLVGAARVKIYIFHDYSATPRRDLFPRQDMTACNDKQKIEGAMLPGMSLNQRVQFYKSEYANDSINNFIMSTTVPGLNSTTVSRVLEILRSEGCPVYIFGGVVRDQFLGLTPNDVDVEVDCELSSVVFICRRQWGADVCGNESDNITHIGQPHHPRAIDLAPTTSTFNSSLANLEYTVNSLAYSTNGDELIIDLSGSGVTDVCARKIRIPSDDDSESSWIQWMSPNKLYRYWKLRSKGFNSYNSNTSNFIITAVKNEIEAQVPIGKSFKQFYCKTVYEAPYNANENVCQTSTEDCERANNKASIYNMVLQEDLGREYIYETIQLPTCGKYMLITSNCIITIHPCRSNFNCKTIPAVFGSTHFGDDDI